MHCFRLLLILFIFGSSGCQLTLQRMPTPPSLQGVAALPVQRFGLLRPNAPMTAGPWKLTDISVGPWTHSCSYHLLSFDTIGSQSYAFTVISQEKALNAACEIKRSARFYRWNNEPEDGMRHSGLECKFQGSSEGSLHLDDPVPKGTKSGSFTLGPLLWKIRSVHGEGLMVSVNPLGYEMYQEDECR
jgi:hypothetical protein